MIKCCLFEIVISFFFRSHIEELTVSGPEEEVPNAKTANCHTSISVLKFMTTVTFTGSLLSVVGNLNP